MAIVKGVNERVHLPLYDSLFVRSEKPLRELVSSNILKFFVNIQGKSKLETNMQSSALLPHWNTFEARALRVVISDFPETSLKIADGCVEPNGNGNGYQNEFSACLKDLRCLLDECNPQITYQQVAAARESLKSLHYAIIQAKGTSKDNEECLGILRRFCDPHEMGYILKLFGNLRSIREDLISVLSRTRITLNNADAVNRFLEELEELEAKGEERSLIRLLERARECLNDFVKLTDLAARIKDQNLKGVEACVGVAEGLVATSPRDKRRAHLEECLRDIAKDLGRHKVKVHHSSATKILGKLIYNSVTTLFVGEKIMIQMPTWFFPAGAGPFSENGQVVTHGFPTPQATFHFAEPVSIDAKQPFRVEIEIPESEALEELQKIYGPFLIWVVLDGYMTRDVQ